MGWLRNFFQGETKALGDLESAWAALVDLGARTASEINVSPSTAMRHPPVRIGVSVRCETLATLGLHVHNREDKSRAEDHPLYKLLHDRPNDWTAATTFIGEMEKDCVLHGRAFALANRVGNDGHIQELLKLKFSDVDPGIDDNHEPIYWVAQKNGGRRKYGWRDILDVPTLDNASAVKQCAEAIGLAMSLERHAAKLMANGARPSGIYKHKKKLSDIAYARLKASVNANLSGENAGKIALLEEDADFAPLTFNSVDIQFQEMRAFQIVEIARALGVPPNLIFDFSRATWANAETASQAFLTFTLMPRAKAWEGALTRLMSPEEQARLYIEFDTNSLVRADIAARFEAYAKAIAARFMNPNEARSKENMAPYDGGDEFINPNIQSAAGVDDEPVTGPLAPKPRLAVV